MTVSAEGQGAGDEIPAGLTSAEARRRLAEFGPNAVVERTAPPWRRYLGKFWGPMPWMLEAAILLQLALGADLEAGIIAGLLIFNATLDFLQGSRATKALAALKQRLAPTAQVRRDGAWIRLPAAELVPGDVVQLPLGAMVPADARIASGAIMVDQSMLTGESVPVDANRGDRVYAGALVRRGQALAEVIATGAHTYFGRAAELVRVAHAASTEQAAVFAVTRNLAVVNGAVGVLLIAYAHVAQLAGAELIRLALTVLLASIPVALPATFTLSAALSARKLAQRGVLLTRLSAAHEAAAMDLLCADKTGTLTHNVLEVAAVEAWPGATRERVLALAAAASSQTDQDPIDAAVQQAARTLDAGVAGRIVRFVPFDPATKIAEARLVDDTGTELRIVKGAFQVVAAQALGPADARARVDHLAAQGNRVIAVAAGPPGALRLAGLIAINDPPREDSAALVTELRELGVRTVMITGDSAVTAQAIARRVGLSGTVCPPADMATAHAHDACDVYARVLPEQKYGLVKRFQSAGHAVGMCGDGTNDAPALRQAQIGIAVSSATDAAKAAAGLVLTEPGLAGIVAAVREGRSGFQRLLSYTLAMLVKKIEIVPFLALGLVLTGGAVLTPALMVLMIVTNDFLSMALTTDHAGIGNTPSRWRMPAITAAALALGACKLAFSTVVLVLGQRRLALDAGQLQTLAFVTLVAGAQAMMYVVRERRALWSSRPSAWLLAASAVDLSLAATFATRGWLMAPLPWPVVAAVFVSAAVFALLLDRLKQPIFALAKLS